MNAPNIATDMVADAMHAERQRHAERIHKIRAERGADAVAFDRTAQRLLTARRLATAGVATVLAAALTVGMLWPDQVQAAGSGGAGGGAVLIR